METGGGGTGNLQKGIEGIAPKLGEHGLESGGGGQGLTYYRALSFLNDMLKHRKGRGKRPKKNE